MAYFKTAYETKACEGLQVTKLIQALREATIRNLIYTGGWDSEPQGSLYQNVYQTHWLLGGSYDATLVPGFAHPVLFEHDSTGALVFGVDDRPYIRQRVDTGEYRVAARSEFELMAMRVAFNQIWVEDNYEILQDFSSLPMRAYALWLANALAHSLKLDPRGKMICQVIASVHYLSCWLPTTVTEWTDLERTRIALTLVRGLRVSHEEIQEILNQLQGPIHGVKALCAELTEHVGSVRLNNFNAGLLYAMVGGTWFGANAKEILDVAIEHPPTWLALLVQAIQDRGYRNSGLAKLLEQNFRRDTDAFVRSAMNLIAHY